MTLSMGNAPTTNSLRQICTECDAMVAMTLFDARDGLTRLIPCGHTAATKMIDVGS